MVSSAFLPSRLHLRGLLSSVSRVPKSVPLNVPFIFPLVFLRKISHPLIFFSVGFSWFLCHPVRMRLVSPGPRSRPNSPQPLYRFRVLWCRIGFVYFFFWSPPHCPFLPPCKILRFLCFFHLQPTRLFGDGGLSVPFPPSPFSKANLFFLSPTVYSPYLTFTSVQFFLSSSGLFSSSLVFVTSGVPDKTISLNRDT